MVQAFAWSAINVAIVDFDSEELFSCKSSSSALGPWNDSVNTDINLMNFLNIKFAIMNPNVSEFDAPVSSVLT